MEILLVCGEAHLLAQSLHLLEGIDTRTQHEEHWSCRACLLEGDLKGNVLLLHVLCTQLLLDKETGWKEVVRKCMLRDYWSKRRKSLWP